MSFFLFGILLLSCTISKNDTEKPGKQDNPEENVVMTMEDSIRRHVESQLSIQGTEEYGLEMYEAECTGDESIDRVITVNLLDRALKEAIASGDVAKRAEMGYMGLFNYIIFQDGASGTLSKPIPIPSSPQAALHVEFDHIVSNRYNDIMVDYRIRNSGFRAFFSVANGHTIQVFQAQQFDGLGTDNPIGFIFEYREGRGTLAKEILVYKATFENPAFTDPDKVYSFTPERTSTGELERRWFFRPKEYKYFTDQN